MTILDKNRDINELIKNGILKKKYLDDEHEYTFTLKGRYILCDGFITGSEYNTIDKRLDCLSQEARRAYYIQKIFEAVGITINDLESNYRVQSFANCETLFKRKSGNIYTFIELITSYYADYGKSLKMVSLDVDSGNLVYDRIDLEELKHYHAESKISDFTLNRINLYWDRKWQKDGLNQNDLYDVTAADAPKKEFHCAWDSMDNYGEYVSDLDTEKLDKHVCKVIKYQDGTANIIDN
jgi:hypothetical protein